MHAIAWLVSAAALAPSMTSALADTLYCTDRKASAP
jgi:hypothetical protein